MQSLPDSGNMIIPIPAEMLDFYSTFINKYSILVNLLRIVAAFFHYVFTADWLMGQQALLTSYICYIRYLLCLN